MFGFVFLLISVLPMVGLLMMEAGAYGPDIWVHGHSNGASFGYGAHLVVMCVVYASVLAILRRTWLPSIPVSWLPGGFPPLYDTGSYGRLAVRALVLNVALLAFVYFISGASAVVAGLMDKGQFRTQARFGYVAFLSRDFLSPMLSALTAYVFMRLPERRTADYLLLAANLLVTAAAGAIWGYRAAMLMMLIPACMMLAPRVTLVRATVLVLGGIVAATGFGVLYERVDARTAFGAVMTRASVGVANSTWRVWDIARFAPELIPPYTPTLGAAIGTRIGALFGVDTNAALDVSQPKDYGTLTTLIAKNFSNGVDNTSNVTTGAFAEGVIAFGIPWYLLMSLLVGLVVAVNRATFEFGLSNGRPLVAVLAANYFMASTFSWLNSGGITILVLIPLLVNYVLTYLIAGALLRQAGIESRHPSGWSAASHTPPVTALAHSQ